MEIELDEPYSNDWSCGYLRIKEKRRVVDLYRKGKMSSTQYARYLLAVSEGRYLTEDEEADHIDSDCTNDDINNLQILHKRDHKEKTKKERSGQAYVDMICPNCGKVFPIPRNRTFLSKPKVSLTFCSRKCNGEFSKGGALKHTSELISFLRNNCILREYINK